MDQITNYYIVFVFLFCFFYCVALIKRKEGTALFTFMHVLVNVGISPIFVDHFNRRRRSQTVNTLTSIYIKLSQVLKNRTHPPPQTI